MRRRARTDANHAQVIAALRAVGAEVVSLHQVGGGVPDLLVLYKGAVRLLEVKDGAKSASRRKLTPAEKSFAERWPVLVVASVREALGAIGVQVA